jgi:NAD(P)H-flavin reductase
MKNPYLPIPMRIEKTLIESEDRMLKTFDLVFIRKEDEEEFSFMPGQFCEVSVFGKGEAPFGIASSPTERGFLRFTVNKAGVVTTALHQLEEGDELWIRGPLGNYYPIKEFEGKNVVVIGGGFAFTTLRSLMAYMLSEENRPRFGEITLIYGARRPDLLLYKEDLASWEERDDVLVYLTVDTEFPGWTKKVGYVPTVLGEVAPSSKDAYAVVCGPPIMIRFTIPKLRELGFPPERMYTSLERRMKCGIGKCGRCNIGHLYVCKDGPVFNYAQLEKLPKEV